MAPDVKQSTLLLIPDSAEDQERRKCLYEAYRIPIVNEFAHSNEERFLKNIAKRERMSIEEIRMMPPHLATKRATRGRDKGRPTSTRGPQKVDKKESANKAAIRFDYDEGEVVRSTEGAIKDASTDEGSTSESDEEFGAT